MPRWESVSDATHIRFLLWREVQNDALLACTEDDGIFNIERSRLSCPAQLAGPTLAPQQLQDSSCFHPCMLARSPACFLRRCQARRRRKTKTNRSGIGAATADFDALDAWGMSGCGSSATSEIQCRLQLLRGVSKVGLRTPMRRISRFCFACRDRRRRDLIGTVLSFGRRTGGGVAHFNALDVEVLPHDEGLHRPHVQAIQRVLEAKREARWVAPVIFVVPLQFLHPFIENIDEPTSKGDLRSDAP